MTLHPTEEPVKVCPRKGQPPDLRAREHGIAVFDLDHTLFAGNSSYHFGSYLFQQHLFSTPTMLYLVGCYACHKLLAMPSETLHSLIFAKLFRGRLLPEMEQHARRFLDQQFASLCNPSAVNRLLQLQQEGLYTLILSNSPSFLVELIAERFGVDTCAATDYGVDKDRRFCTISQLMQGNDKAAYILDLAKRWEVAKQRIWAFSDSSLDLPLLENVGCPVGVQPERRLRQICKSRGWEVI